MSIYESKEYSEFLKKSEKILESAKNDTLAFYRGVAYLKEGLEEKSIMSLNNLSMELENAFYYEANWYIALAYLSREEYSRSLKYLEILKGTSDYGMYSQKIINEIKDDQ
ncbi:MAG: hypothetical protein V1720_07415 [bacterium]